jgi:hypothetical protein
MWVGGFVQFVQAAEVHGMIEPRALEASSGDDSLNYHWVRISGPAKVFE